MEIQNQRRPPRLKEHQEQVNGAERNASVALMLLAPREIILAHFAARTPPLNPTKPSQRGGEHDTYSKSDYASGD